MKKIILFGGMWLLCAATAFSQDGNNYWERMKQSHPMVSMDELMTQNVHGASLSNSQNSGTSGYRLSLVYGGQFRKVTPTNQTLIQQMGLKSREQKKYQYELLFKHNNQEVWLPIQTNLIEQLELEVRENEPVTLYTAILPAAQPVSGSPVPMVVEEFQVK